MGLLKGLGCSLYKDGLLGGWDVVYWVVLGLWGYGAKG